MDSRRLEGLDALRGIAAMCVLVFHTTGSSSNAYLAVDFFFMLSGYVMARTYESKLAAGGSGLTFFRSRVARLWPTMFAASLIGLPWLASRVSPDLFWPVALANLLLIPVPIQNRSFLLNEPAWSIMFELLANAVHALVLWRLSNRQLVLLLVPLVAGLGWYASLYTLEMGSKPETLGGGVFRVLTGYTIGILLWRLWRDVPRMQVSRPFTLSAMPILFGLSALVEGQSWQADMLFVLIVAPMLIAGGLRIERAGALLGWLGAISFPLYAVHSPILRSCQMVGLNPWIGAILSIAAAALLARMFIGKRPARPVSATAALPGAATG